jgi:hypothetical protein
MLQAWGLEGLPSHCSATSERKRLNDRISRERMRARGRKNMKRSLRSILGKFSPHRSAIGPPCISKRRLLRLFFSLHSTRYCGRSIMNFKTMMQYWTTSRASEATTKDSLIGCFSAPARSVAEEGTEVAFWVSTHVHLNHQSTTISPIGGSDSIS